MDSPLPALLYRLTALDGASFQLHNLNSVGAPVLKGSDSWNNNSTLVELVVDSRVPILVCSNNMVTKYAQEATKQYQGSTRLCKFVEVTPPLTACPFHRVQHSLQTVAEGEDKLRNKTV